MKMIKLTAADDTAIFVNIAYISSIITDAYGDTEITTTNNDNLYCKESTEEVYQKIKEIEND